MLYKSTSFKALLKIELKLHGKYFYITIDSYNKPLSSIDLVTIYFFWNINKKQHVGGIFPRSTLSVIIFAKL